MSKNFSVLVAAGRIVAGSGACVSEAFSPSLVEGSSEFDDGEVSWLEFELVEADSVAVVVPDIVVAVADPFFGIAYVLVVNELVPEPNKVEETVWGAPKNELSSRVSKKSLFVRR